MRQWPLGSSCRPPSSQAALLGCESKRLGGCQKKLCPSGQRIISSRLHRQDACTSRFLGFCVFARGVASHAGYSLSPQGHREHPQARSTASRLSLLRPGQPPILVPNSLESIKCISADYFSSALWRSKNSEQSICIWCLLASCTHRETARAYRPTSQCLALGGISRQVFLCDAHRCP